MTTWQYGFKGNHDGRMQEVILKCPEFYYLTSEFLALQLETHSNHFYVDLHIHFKDYF